MAPSSSISKMAGSASNGFTATTGGGVNAIKLRHYERDCR